MNGTAQIHRPVRGQVAVKIAGRRCSRATLRALLGGGIQVAWDRQRGVFLLARHHLERLLAACVANFRVVEVHVDSRTTELCTPACAAANPDSWWDCVCSCRAANHGGGAAGRLLLLGEGAVFVLSSGTTRTTCRYVDGRLQVPDVAR